MSDVKNKRVVIYIDQAAAEDALGRLQTKADGFNNKVKNVRAEQEKLLQKIKETGAAGGDITKLQTRYDELGRKVNGYNKDLKTTVDQQQKLKQQIDSGITPSFAQLNSYVSRLRNELKYMSQDAPEYASKFGAYKKASEQLGQLKTAMNGVETAQKSWLQNAKGIGLGVFIGGFMQSAISSIGTYIGSLKDLRKEFEVSVQNLSAITGATGADLEFLKNAAIDMSTRGVRSAREYVEAMKLIGSAKPELLSHKELLVEVTEASRILSEASGIDLPEAAKNLSDALNQYGASARESATYVDALAAASKYGAAEVPQVTESLLQFGTQAKSSNINIYESVAAIELLAEKGLKGAEAGTKLRNVFLALNAVDGLDKKALDSLEKAGVNTEILKDKSLSLQTRLEELSKISGNAASLVAVFGKENFNAGQIILQNIPRYAELAEQVRETGIAAQQAKTNTDTWAASWENLKNVASAQFLEGDNSFFVWFNRSLADSIKGMGDFAKAFATSGRSISETMIRVRTEAAVESDKNYVKNVLANRTYTVDETDSKGNVIRNKDGSIRKQKKQRTATEMQALFEADLKLDELSLQEALISKDKERISLSKSRLQQSKMLVEAIKDEAAAEKQKLENAPATPSATPVGKSVLDETKKKIEAARAEYQRLIKEVTDSLNKASMSDFQYSFNKIFEIRKEQEQKLKDSFKLGAINDKQLKEGMDLIFKETVAKITALNNSTEKKVDITVTPEIIPVIDEKEVDEFFQQVSKAFKRGQEKEAVYNKNVMAGLELNVLNAGSAKEKLDAQIAFLEEKRKQEILFTDATGNEVALINKKYDDQITDAKTSHLLQQVDLYSGYASQVLDIFSMLASAQNNRDNQLHQAEIRRIDEKRRKLTQNSKFGLITQQEYQIQMGKLDKEADDKKRALELRQFQRNQKIQIAQTFINSATAGIKLWAQPGFPAAIPLAILLAGQTFAAINSINSQQPVFEKGGISMGSRHSEGGINMVDSRSGKKVGEMEGGEPYMILSRNTYRNNKGIVDSLLHTSMYNGGAPIKPSWQTRPYFSIDYSGLSKAGLGRKYLADGGIFTNQQNATANSVPSEVMVHSDPELKMLLSMLMDKLDQPISAYISQKRIEDDNDLRYKVLNEARA
jgi:TP901 family phage tail tape measure protein